MAKTADSKGTPDNHHHLVNSKGFGLLIVGFLVLKIVSLLFLPEKNLIQASDLTLDNILTSVNRERQQRNLVTLNSNDKLSLAAQSKSDDMINRKYFAHIDPDGHYIWDKIVAAGYTPYLQLGENLAIEFYDTDSLIAAWMNSPTHRANILQEGFRDQGMGTSLGEAQLGQYHSAVANTFGTLAVSKKSQNPPPQIAKASPPAQSSSPKPAKIPAKKKPVPPKTLGTETPPAPIPATAPSPAPESQATTEPSTQIPSLTPPAENTEPLKPRESPPMALNPTGDFALPPQNQASQSQATEAPSSISVNFSKSASGVVGNESSTTLTDYQTNRYLILILGVALLLFMLSDIKKAVETKFGSLDKKINNLAVLLISLVVIAFMYWL